MGCCTCKVFSIVIGVLGIVLVVLGAILGFAVIPPIIDDQITEKFQLLEGSEQYDRWKVTPMPLQFKVHIFNVLNEQEIMAGEKPQIKEQGPYVYTMNRHKSDVVYDKSTDTYEYLQNSVFEFDDEASAPLTEEDIVTVLNVPLQGAFQKAEGLFGDTWGLNNGWPKMFPDTETLFHTITVKEFLFGGYKFCDPDIVSALSKAACDKVKVQGLQTITEDDGFAVFAFFKHKNTTSDGPYIIQAGNNDIHQLGAILKWKNQTVMDKWGEEENNKCNTIRGRDSTIYPPFNNDSSVFDIFNNDICRIVSLQTKGEATYKDIDGNMATLSVANLANSNGGECYCIKGIGNLAGEKECLPDGFGDLSSCTGAAVIMSFPHFLYVDSDYKDTVIGLEPNEDLHKTFVIYEPATGTPLRGAKRMQFNMVIREVEGFTITQGVTPAMLPILWVEEGVELSDDLLDMLNEDYFDKLVMVDAITYTLIGVGAALFLIGFGVFIFKSCGSK